MKVRRALLTFLAILVMLPYAPDAAANTRAGLPIYVRETGHTLAYAFREFYDGRGGLAVFGLPLTEVFLEDGRPVQYFERARLEWDAQALRVQIGLLGRWAARGRERQPAFQPQPAGRTGASFFPETGHTLAGAFLDYWQRGGGLATFGYPISEEFREASPVDGRFYTVQYFERARFEFHPDQPDASRVLLSHLGRQYLAASPAPEAAVRRARDVSQAWDGIRPTRVRIPRIGVETPVVGGGYTAGAWDVPRHTAVHYWPVSAYPGTAGNIVIAGHVGYHGIIFNRLPDVAQGDEIFVDVGERSHRYVVREVLTLLPDATWVMAPTQGETLTLITCVPIGVYTHRLIVRAEPVV